MPTRARLISAGAAFAFALLAVARVEAADYFVSTTGNDSAEGTSEASAWRTIAFAATKATAGDTVYIKAGLYHGETVVVGQSGTETAPVVFQGYTSQPGDKLDPKYVPGSLLDATRIPVLEGEATEATEAIGIEIDAKAFVEVRNLGMTRYNYGLLATSSQHVTVENVYAVGMGPGPGMGLIIRSCADSTVRNSVIADAYDSNMMIWKSQTSLFENIKSYAAVYDPPAAATDYHIVIKDSQDLVVRGCSAENLHPQIKDAHHGHGIGIKDYASPDGYHNPHSERNKIIDCVSHNTYEPFYVAHEAHDNEFIGCVAIADHELQSYSFAAIIVRDGAHHNTFRNFYAQGPRSGVILQETVEGPDGVEQVVSHNQFVDSVFVDTVKGIELWNADNNLFTNCVFDRTGSWVFVRFPFERPGKGNACRNSIVTGITGEPFLADKGSTEQFAFTYTDFWQNAFAVIPGQGNLEQDPLFADPAKGDYHLRSAEGRYDPATSAWVKDSTTSPCIDQGDPSDDYTAEPCPNGDRINMGSHGNTAHASKGAQSDACVGGPPAEAGSGGYGGFAEAGPVDGSSGPAQPAGPGSNDAAGCGCRMARRSPWAFPALFAAAGAMAAARRRRGRPEAPSRGPGVSGPESVRA